MGEHGRQKDAFLVKLWSESQAHGESPSTKLRGSVEHLATRQRRYFSALVDLVSFLTSVTEMSDLEYDERIDSHDKGT
jgi:hypothetical protein